MATRFVYVVRADNFYKIGQTGDLSERVRSYNTLPWDVELVCSFPSKFSDMVERELHRRFADKRVRGEWFALDDSDVALLKTVESADEPEELPRGLWARSINTFSFEADEEVSNQIRVFALWQGLKHDVAVGALVRVALRVLRADTSAVIEAKTDSPSSDPPVDPSPSR